MTMFLSRSPSWANEWNWSAKSRFHLVCLAKGQSQWLAWMVKMLLKSVLFRLLEISLIPSARYFFVINLLDKHLCYNNTVILPSCPSVIYPHVLTVCLKQGSVLRYFICTIPFRKLQWWNPILKPCKHPVLPKTCIKTFSAIFPVFFAVMNAINRQIQPFILFTWQIADLCGQISCIARHSVLFKREDILFKRWIYIFIFIKLSLKFRWEGKEIPNKNNCL